MLSNTYYRTKYHWFITNSSNCDFFFIDRSRRYSCKEIVIQDASILRTHNLDRILKF